MTIATLHPSSQYKRENNKIHIRILEHTNNPLTGKNKKVIVKITCFYNAVNLHSVLQNKEDYVLRVYSLTERRSWEVTDPSSMAFFTSGGGGINPESPKFWVSALTTE